MIHTDFSKILILDTETTGLANTDEILQLSVIDGLGKKRIVHADSVPDIFF